MVSKFDVSRALLSFGVSVACAVCGAAQAAAPPPSRAPDPGCTWRPFQGLGLRLLVQDCTSDSEHYVFSVRGDWIEHHRPSDDRIFGSHQVIRVLRKPAAMPIEQAVRRFALPTLPREAHGRCAVTRADRSPVKDKRKIVLTLEPIGTYLESILRRQELAAWCGPYGGNDMITYFEYHPYESRTRFLFVVYGWDEESLFDEQNIQIGDLPK
nr:hypothetical protein [uncultured Rhodopila sp.]